MSEGPVAHADGKSRCWWPGTDELYVAYHDTEWGVPEFDDRALFEKLILDGLQAGLSWITILRKRENFRRAFAGFDPAAVARFDAAHVEALMLDAGIVRNRAKIEGAVASARAYLAIQERQGFSRFLWEFVGNEPIQSNLHSRAQYQAETGSNSALKLLNDWEQESARFRMYAPLGEIKRRSENAVERAA